MRDIAERTQGSVRMGPGTLYGTIQRMLADKLIVVADERPDPAHDDERRRYYRLSDLGLRVARAEALRLERLVHLAQTKRVLYGPELMGGA